jgi:hypothetical protein
MKRMIAVAVLVSAALLAGQDSTAKGGAIMVPHPQGGFRNTSAAAEERDIQSKLKDAKKLLAGEEVLGINLATFAWLWRSQERPIKTHKMIYPLLSAEARAAIDEIDKLLADVKAEPPPKPSTARPKTVKSVIVR